MNKTNLLKRDFYQIDPQTVARQLIGKSLVRIINGLRISGIIYETEAYDGETDLACHASSGKSDRNSVMYGDGGHAYVYFTYGMHWMMNCVTGIIGYPSAVLIRAVLPIDGIDHIKSIRLPIKEAHWCDGPGKLTKALSITKALNGTDICDSNNPLFIENAPNVPDDWIEKTPRIGIIHTPDPWRSKPWRYIADVTKLRSN